MKTILVPIDFSEISKRVIKEAAVLARMLDARIVLMNVTQPPYVGAEFYGAMVENLATITAAAEEYARKHLARLKKTLEHASLKADAVQETGYPVALILDQSKKLSADYIVMGSHGHTAFYDLLVGSVASGVLHKAACPVVVVPPLKKKSRR